MGAEGPGASVQGEDGFGGVGYNLGGTKAPSAEEQLRILKERGVRRLRERTRGGRWADPASGDGFGSASGSAPSTSRRFGDVPLGETGGTSVSSTQVGRENDEQVVVVAGVSWGALFDPEGLTVGDAALLTISSDVRKMQVDEAYSPHAVHARDLVIDEMYRLAHTAVHPASIRDDAVRVTTKMIPGVVLIMQQQGLCAAAVNFGRNLLHTHDADGEEEEEEEAVARRGGGAGPSSVLLDRSLERDVRLGMSLCCCSLAQAKFQDGRIADGCEYLNQALHVLRSFDTGPARADAINADLVREIEAGLETMLPECCLEHLSLPLQSRGDEDGELGGDGEGNNEVRRGAVDTLRMLLLSDIEDVSNDHFGRGTGAGQPNDWWQQKQKRQSVQQQQRRGGRPLLSSSYVNDALRQLTSTELMMMMQQSFSHVVDLPMLTRQWPGFLQLAIYAHIAHGYYYRDYDDIVKAHELLERYKRSTGQSLAVERSLLQVLLGDMDKAEEILVVGGSGAAAGDDDELMLPVTSDMVIRSQSSDGVDSESGMDVSPSEAPRVPRVSGDAPSSSTNSFVLATSRASYTNITYGAAMAMVMRAKARDGDSVSAFVDLTESWLCSSVLCRFRDTAGAGARDGGRATAAAGAGRGRRRRRTTTSLVDYFDSPWIKSMATMRSLSQPMPEFAPPAAKLFRAFVSIFASCAYWVLSRLSNSFLRSDVKRFTGFTLKRASARNAAPAGGSATFFAATARALVAVAVVASVQMLRASVPPTPALAGLATAMTSGTASVVKAAANTVVPEWSGGPRGATSLSSSPPSSPSSSEVRQRRPATSAAPSPAHSTPVKESGALQGSLPPGTEEVARRQLSLGECQQLVQQWQLVKSMALGKDHSRSLLGSVLTDRMLEQWSKFSVEAEREGWHWTYDLRGIKIKSVQAVLHGERERAPEFVVVAKISEGASVVERGRVTQSYDAPYQVVYRVKMCLDGAWRIARAELR